MSENLLPYALAAYVGTKKVLATPMTRGDYNNYRGWQIPVDEDPNEEGYLVEYVDGGKPNDDRHKGYISWSPKDVFEHSYKQGGMGQVSDGYHTFDELYDHRMKLFAVICGAFSGSAWKSKLHHDGTMYDDYFIVGVSTELGQFTYHYHINHWDLFQVAELDCAPEWDGHTSNDVTRLFSLIEPKGDGCVEDPCCEAETECTNSRLGEVCGSNAMNAVPSSQRSQHEDVYMLTEVMKVTQSGPEQEPAIVASHALTKLINEMFPVEKNTDAQVEQPSTPKDRVVQEQTELADKIAKLGDFIAKGKPDFLDSGHWHLLAHQIEVMKEYNTILLKRLEKF